MRNLEALRRCTVHFLGMYKNSNRLLLLCLEVKDCFQPKDERDAQIWL